MRSLGYPRYSVVLALSLAWPSGPAEAIELRLPINCEIGVTCEIQNYVDLDPSSQARDYQCGSRTYNGHKGVDFRLPSLRAQRAGVNVLAAAPGRVLRVRDGVPDMSVRERGIGAVNDRECGNGVVVDHGEGWSTQYCHMAQGSLLVKPGDKVEASQPLGRVGLSGMTEYPHLHFAVTFQGKLVEPFAFGAPEGSCGGGRSLWEPSLQSALAYKPRAVLNTGFTNGRSKCRRSKPETFLRRRLRPPWWPTSVPSGRKPVISRSSKLRPRMVAFWLKAAPSLWTAIKLK